MFYIALSVLERFRLFDDMSLTVNNNSNVNIYIALLHINI